MEGYLKIYRTFFKHPLWEEARSHSRAEAFLDLLQLAAFAPTKRIVKGKLIHLQIGELVASERFLQTRWSWSRTKVRNFINLLKQDQMLDQRKDQQETVLQLLNYADYAEQEYSKKTTDNTTDNTKREPVGDHEKTSDEPNKKKDKKDKKDKITKSTAASRGDAGGGEDSEKFILTRRKRKLTGRRLEAFEAFWDAFDYKKDRANAADAWLDIPELTQSLVRHIVSSAKRAAKNRQREIAAGKTPQYAQGWITGRRWEDFDCQPEQPGRTPEPTAPRFWREALERHFAAEGMDGPLKRLRSGMAYHSIREVNPAHLPAVERISAEIELEGGV